MESRFSVGMTVTITTLGTARRRRRFRPFRGFCWLDLALAVFVINRAHASSMEQTIARIAGASYEFFAGKPQRPQPAHAALSSGERTCDSRNQRYCYRDWPNIRSNVLRYPRLNVNCMPSRRMIVYSPFAVPRSSRMLLMFTIVERCTRTKRFESN